MNDSPQRTKLDDLLRDAVDLTARPDFAAWQAAHPEAVDAIRSFPTILKTRRSKMIRIARYCTSAAAVLLVAIGAWWMFFGHGTASAWAQVIDQLAKVHSATCRMSVYEDGHCQETAKILIEGDRVRSEDTEVTCVMDCHEGKVLFLEHAAKRATLHDLQKDSGERAVLGSNPLSDLVKLKDAAAKRQADETVEGVSCHVYRVENPVLLGSKVPWVKLWVDPRSNLPVQVHMVEGSAEGASAVTFNRFRWNEAFDENLLKLAAPQGYTLVDEQERDETKKRGKSVSMQAAVAAWEAAEGARANPGREIRGEEAAKILDMLSRRTKANYKAIVLWSGTYELGMTPAPAPVAVVMIVDFFLENSRDRLRINDRATLAGLAAGPLPLPQPAASRGNAAEPVPEWQEYRWIRTAEYSLRFPVNELRSRVEGLADAGDASGKPFRILYREGSEPTHHFDNVGTWVDPRSFLGGTNGVTYWDGCSARAAALRGERSKYCNDPEFLKRNLLLRERRNAAATEYVLFLRYGGDGDNSHLTEQVFSAEAGFNVTSTRSFSHGRVAKSEKTSYRQEKGIYIPVRIESDSPNHRVSRVFTLKQSKLNEPIDPAMFEMSSLGLRRGDRLADWIERRVQVFDGKQFVPVEQFKSGR
jgi:hypothetical protein